MEATIYKSRLRETTQPQTPIWRNGMYGDGVPQALMLSPFAVLPRILGELPKGFAWRPTMI
jgi:hypothetical protein